MHINTVSTGGTMTTLLLCGYAIYFVGAPIEKDYDVALQETLYHERYRVSSELTPSFSLPEKGRVSLSPKHMMSQLNSVTSSLTAALHEGTKAHDSEQVHTSLAELNKSLRLSLTTFGSDTEYTEDYLRENSLKGLISELRNAEKTVADHLALSQGDDIRTLRRALAQSRSLAVRAQQMIDQRLVIPEVFEGRASREGLKALADMATKRLQYMAG